MTNPHNNAADFAALIDRMKTVSAEKGIALDRKTYTMVVHRVEEFRRAFGDLYGIHTDIVHYGKAVGEPIVVRAAIIRQADRAIVATGHAEEVRGSNEVNAVSALENAETSAIGRALASLGLAGGEFASANEMSGVGRKHTAKTTDAKAAWDFFKKQANHQPLPQNEQTLSGTRPTIIVADDVDTVEAVYEQPPVSLDVLDDEIVPPPAPQTLETVDSLNPVIASPDVEAPSVEELAASMNGGDAEHAREDISEAADKTQSGESPSAKAMQAFADTFPGDLPSKLEPRPTTVVKPSRPAFLGPKASGTAPAKTAVDVKSAVAENKIRDGHPIQIPYGVDDEFLRTAAGVLDQVVRKAFDTATLDRVHKANAGLWVEWKRINPSEHDLFMASVKARREVLTKQSPKTSNPVDAADIPF